MTSHSQAVIDLMADKQKAEPVAIGKILSESEMGVGWDRRAGDVIWWAKPQGPAMLYAEPPAPAAVPQDESRCMFVARLENMQENGDRWITVNAVLALLSDCDMLAAGEKP